MARSAAKKRPRDTMVTRASNGGGGEEFGLQGRSTRRGEASTVLALSAGFGARARARRRWLAAEPRPISARRCKDGRTNAKECACTCMHCTALHCTARASQLAWSPTHGARCVGPHCTALYPAFTGLLSSPLMRKCASPRLPCRGGHSVFALMHSTLMHSWTFIPHPGTPGMGKRSP